MAKVKASALIKLFLSKKSVFNKANEVSSCVHEVLFMKCRRAEEREKQLRMSAFQKKLYPKGTKVCLGESFLPSYHALSDNTYTNTLRKVLRISYPKNILSGLFQKRYGNWLQIWKQVIFGSSVIQNTFRNSVCFTVTLFLSENVLVLMYQQL